MSRRLTELQANLQRCRDLVGLGQRLYAMTHALVDPTDIYRAALAQSISSLDHYVHSIVLDRGVDILLGRLPPCSPSRVGPLSQASVAAILSEGPLTIEIAIRAHLASTLSKETFQSGEDIAKALASVGVNRIWTAAFGNSANATKTRLGLIVGRRNRIVHQCDTDPLNPGAPVGLSDVDALDAVDFVGTVVVGIDGFV